MHMHMRARALVTLVTACGLTLAMTTASYASGVTVTDLNNGATATGLAQSLVGAGVSISNVTYTGNNRAAGSFTGGAGSIGFDSGIVLSSGKVETYPTDPPCSQGVEGPNTCYESTTANPGGGPAGLFNSTGFGGPGDADLTALSGFPTFDAAVLEFDFVPQQSTIQFNYVFGSEEYSDYSNTSFNDVLGLFVNGVNCAVVPGTNQAVSVNTINDGNDRGGDATPHNAQYFRDNVNPSGPTIDSQFDGLTTVLTCTATVTPGQINHLKLAVADASDDVLDSGFFVQAGSLTSGTQISTSLQGAGQTGAQITVPSGTSVTDTSTLTGATASGAGGTVSYKVYSDAVCATQVADGGTKMVTNGSVPASDPVAFSQAGTYYWQAAYSGDANNNASQSVCGAEQLTVQAPTDQTISASGQAVSATEGQSLNGATVATFTDPDTSSTASEYSASIDWGDGSTSTGTISGSGGSFAVTGTHTYGDEGSDPIKVTITDTDNTSNSATVNDMATVNDAALTATGFTSPGPVSGESVNVNAGFTDANASSTTADFTATINWGDGSAASPAMVSGSAGSYAVAGGHNYTSTGYYTIKVHVADDGGSVADEQIKVLIYATPAGGNFVISSKKSAIGTAVTFWGSQWAKLNPLNAAAPSQFKGFEDSPTLPACGQTWKSDPGNSTPPPPGPLPDYMAVIVSSSVLSAPGNAITGNTQHLVVVKTNPGYQPDPAFPGTGTVVATIC